MVQHIDQSYKSILDREGAVEMSSNFADIIELVCELVDYGSNLIPRAYASSERDLKAICLILVQLRQFVSQLDGMALLLAQGACATSNLQLRGVLEIAQAEALVATLPPPEPQLPEISITLPIKSHTQK